jgi:hypothetical protein
MTGAHHALCANSYFRHRHDRVKRFKNPRIPNNRRQFVSQFGEMARMARYHIAEARKLGFRGTFLQAAEAIQKMEG